jgi:hypothetical protein
MEIISVRMSKIYKILDVSKFEKNVNSKIYIWFISNKNKFEN